jgi:hypothetical protein
MRRLPLPLGGWIAASCLVGSALWACSGVDTNPFANGSRGGQTSTGGATSGSSGMSGSSTGGSVGGTASGGASGSASGGDATGGALTGGTTGDGGEGAVSGSNTGGSTVGGAGGGMGGDGGTPPTGGAGMSGAGMSGAGMSGAGMGGAGAGGAGAGGAGAGGKGGMGGAPADCKLDTQCPGNQYCKKANCDDEDGHCTAPGPECRGTAAAFEPVCGCDGITYWNRCVVEHEGFNVAAAGECTGNNRPVCTRDAGGVSCPLRLNAHCYRPVDQCGEPSPTMGFCWVLPPACPTNEEQTQRYCGGPAGSARCIGLCEVISAENSFQRDAGQCN